MIKRERDIEDMIERAGLELMNFAKNGAHYQVTLRAQNGATRRFAMAKTPSDSRGDLNQEAELKRWARENTSDTAIALAMKSARDPGLPKPLPIKTPEPKPMTAKPQPLSHIEFYKACEWLKTADLDSRPMTPGQLAVVASTALGFTVPESQVGQCLEAVGLKLVPPTIKVKDAVRYLSRELLALMKELGKEPSKELLAMSQEATAIEV